MSKRQRRRTRGAMRAVRRAAETLVQDPAFAIEVAVETIEPGDTLIVVFPDRIRSIEAMKSIRDQLMRVVNGETKVVILEGGARLKVLRRQMAPEDRPPEPEAPAAKPAAVSAKPV